MDPQSQSFTPFGGSSSSGGGEPWRLQNDVMRLQQVQSEHSDRIGRLERRQDEDARVKSVWGNQSPFPSVLSGGAGGTPNQGTFEFFCLALGMEKVKRSGDVWTVNEKDRSSFADRPSSSQPAAFRPVPEFRRRCKQLDQ